MRQRYKLLALIFSILFLFSVQIIGFSLISVRAEDEEEYIITWDWLTASVYNDPNDKLMHSIGGYDLKSFENLGIFSQDESGIAFKSRATFGFELNSYLALILRDCYPYININAIKNFQFLRVGYIEWYKDDWSQNYFVTARSVNLGGTWSHNDQYYTNPLQLTVDIVPVFNDFENLTLNGVEINSVDYLYEIKTVVMEVVEKGLCGEYSDYYTDQNTQSGEIDAVKLEKDDPGNSAARSGIIDLGLGWETDDILDVRDDLTIQNVLYNSDPVGTTYFNSGTGAFEFDVMFGLRPEIKYSEQTIHVRKAALIVDTQLNTYGLYGAVTNYDDTFMRSVHVTAPFIHQEYEVTVYFLATVNLDAELHESALDDPYFFRGDWLWNVNIGGTTDVTLVEDDPLKYVFDQMTPWIILILVIALIIVGIYIFLQVGMPLVMFWMGQRSREREGSNVVENTT